MKLPIKALTKCQGYEEPERSELQSDTSPCNPINRNLIAYASSVRTSPEMAIIRMNLTRFQDLAVLPMQKSLQKTNFKKGLTATEKINALKLACDGTFEKMTEIHEQGSAASGAPFVPNYACGISPMILGSRARDNRARRSGGKKWKVKENVAEDARSHQSTVDHRCARMHLVARCVSQSRE